MWWYSYDEIAIKKKVYAMAKEFMRKNPDMSRSKALNLAWKKYHKKNTKNFHIGCRIGTRIIEFFFILIFILLAILCPYTLIISIPMFILIWRAEKYPN